MITPDEIEKFADLARINISDSEKKRFAEDIESILGYVGVVSENVSKEKIEAPEHRNVMREDGEPQKTGEYTEKIVEQFPKKDGDYLSVKKIIEQD